MNCKKCDAMLAPADEVCQRCGEAVDAAEAAQNLLSRAESLRQGGQFEEAIQYFRRALARPLPRPQAAAAWQKFGLLLEKQDQVHPRAGRLAEAGSAYYQARELDDANETLHQLWIANLSNQGSPEPALAYYKKRLADDPGDALAAKMLQIARLSAEFKLNPVKVPARTPVKHGMLVGMVARLLRPNAMTFGLASTSFLISLTLLVVGLSLPSVAPPPPLEGASGVAVDSGIQSTDGGAFFLISGLLFNPVSNLVSCLLWGGYFAFLWKARKK